MVQACTLSTVEVLIIIMNNYSSFRVGVNFFTIIFYKFFKVFLIYYKNRCIYIFFRKSSNSSSEIFCDIIPKTESAMDLEIVSLSKTLPKIIFSRSLFFKSWASLFLHLLKPVGLELFLFRRLYLLKLHFYLFYCNFLLSHNSTTPSTGEIYLRPPGQGGSDFPEYKESPSLHLF